MARSPTDCQCRAASREAEAAPEPRLVLKDEREEHHRHGTALDPDSALAYFCECLVNAPRLTKLTVRTGASAGVP